MHILSMLFLLITALAITGCGGGSSAPTTNNSSPPQAPKLLGSELDKKMNRVMQESGATAAVVAVARNGEIVYEQAYGYKDKALTQPLPVDALMRSGSVVKAVTAAAIRQLQASGVVAFSDRVFCNGSNAPCWLSEGLLSETSDPKAGDITIAQLIAHQGGWYSDVSGEPLEQEIVIRNFLSLDGPPSREDIVRYVMASPLDYTPGSPDYAHDAYSNFGFLLLGMIIEQASQTSYIDYVHTVITDPLGLNREDFKIAASRLVEHDSREPTYISEDLCPSVFEPGEMALCSEEGADNNNWFSALGTISTAGALALFAQHYQLPANYTFGYGVIGSELSTPANGSHGGYLPGAGAMLRQLSSGVSYAILLNVSHILEADLAELDRLSQLPLE